LNVGETAPGRVSGSSVNRFVERYFVDLLDYELLKWLADTISYDKQLSSVLSRFLELLVRF
jgi:hypothetical protein